ncbi:MAG: pyridoxine 5-phosphate synthase [Planctomycetota bacterium]|jgi:pyridoxine 5-phosphate synthase
MPRLHVNIDHVATVRQARREAFPDPLAWALEAEAAGAHGITCHLRKDRRHIQDDDVTQLRAGISTFLNLEVSLDSEMIGLALASRADAFCLVPENRAEVTTEGGLDVIGERIRLANIIPALNEAGGLVSLFIDPDSAQLEATRELGAPFVELHTGSYANASDHEREAELERLRAATAYAVEIGLRVNAGHGLDLSNVIPVARLPRVEELNIGFSIVARSLFVGVREAVREMSDRIQEPAD